MCEYENRTVILLKINEGMEQIFKSTCWKRAKEILSVTGTCAVVK